MNQKGYLLPMVVIFLLLSLIVGMGILSLGGLERIDTRKRLYREKAFYLAEAGAYRAYAHRKEDAAWDWETEGSGTLGEGSFSVVVEEEGTYRINIISTGAVNGVAEVVKIVLGLSAGGLFSGGVFGTSLVSLTGSSQIFSYSSDPDISDDGNNAFVGSNSEVSLGWSTIIHGDVGVATGGSIIYPTGASPITGETHDDLEPRSLEPVEVPPSLLAMGYTPAGTPGLSGNYQVSGHNFTVAKWPRVAAIATGDYKFNNFTLDSDAQLTLNGTVRLYLSGKLDLSGNCRFILAEGATVEIYLGPNSGFSVANSVKMNENGIPSHLAIYSASTKEVSLAGTGDARINAVIYAPSGKVSVTGSSQLRGAIVANEVNVLGDARVYYDITLRPSGGGSGGSSNSYFIRRWTKPGWDAHFR